MEPKTLDQLAQHVGGKVIGDGSITIKSASTLERAGSEDITFLTNRKYTNQLKTTKAGAVVVGSQIESNSALLIADDPYYAFRQIVVLLHGHRQHKKTGISKNAFVADSAEIGKDTDIHNFVTIEENVTIGSGCVLYPGVFIGKDTTIGDGCIIYPNVVVYDKCTIGSRVILQANATIGEDGFGFATHNGCHHKIPHIGSVIIEDDVEIGSNAAIERGTIDDTIIGQGCKIGDQVVIGHGTQLGPHCLLVAQVGIAGSAKLGHHCVAGGQAGIVGHINIGDLVTIAAQGAVINDIPNGSTLMGSPAIDANKAKRAYALIEYLPEMRKSIRKLEKKLAAKEKS
ncbi:MAG: UDP-3-O-(3-hydroxymyristoyl)glucosamine N-acyltransferase [Planctomycetes bacterium]|nr:UDP-3-O-(3-hydroxymyristoyl)glucosamine N-acyltransferase [Planctomycetota bacterium]MBL7107513.1 UDP-3-O-(3-hydroxymyristoyl)glucosamine N-acyltransferase [Phycisphaerae bacterium]